MRWWRKLPVMVTKMHVVMKRMYVCDEAFALDRVARGPEGLFGFCLLEGSSLISPMVD